MKIKLLETAGWYTVFKNLRQSYSLDSRSNIKWEWYDNLKSDNAIINKEYHINQILDIDVYNKDLTLLSTLVKKGDSHSKIIRGLQTYVEITAPRYWWQEWLTYVIGVLEINPTIDWVSLNSESTMHTLKKELKEGVLPNTTSYNKYVALSIKNILERNASLDSTSLIELKSNLPEGYLQTRTFQVSYQAWRRIYKQRYNHKLEEWSKDIVDFIEQLPFAKELITIE